VDPVTRDNEELFATVLAAARLGRAHRIIDRLRERYEKELDNPVAGLPYALAMLAQLQAAPDQDPNYTEIVETLSDLVYYRPQSWLGRYLRVHTRTLLPADATEHRGYILAERAHAGEDVAELIERQAATDWQPWFACSYLLAARLAWESGDRDSVAGLAAAATARPGVAIPFRALGGLLRESFAWYHAQPELPARQDVRDLMRTLFPRQPTPQGASR